jgi:hypothetical protein
MNISQIIRLRIGYASNIDNYDYIIYVFKIITHKSKVQTTSCAAKPFCIANPNLRKTTSIDLDITTLICITLWTLFRSSTVSCARKSNVSNANRIKKCWLSEYAFSCWSILLEATLRAVHPTIKFQPYFHKWGNFSQVYTRMFPSYPSIHHDIRWRKCQPPLWLH